MSVTAIILATVAAVYLGLYSLAILLGTHHGSQTAERELGEQVARELQTGGQQNRWQQRQRTPQFQTQQRRQQTRTQTSRQDGTPVVFKRQRR